MRARTGAGGRWLAAPAGLLLASLARCHSAEPQRPAIAPVIASASPPAASSAAPPVPAKQAARVCKPTPPDTSPTPTAPAVPNLHALWSRTLTTAPLVLADSLLTVSRGRLLRITTATGAQVDVGRATVESVEDACAGGELVVADGPYAAVGLEARTGAERFRVPLPSRPFRGCTVGRDAVFVVADRDGVDNEEVLALRERDGSVLWRAACPPGFMRRPQEPVRQEGATVILAGDAAGRACLLAFDAGTGAPRWSTCAGPQATFAVDARRVVVGDKGGLRVLDPATGALETQVELPVIGVYALALAGDTVTAYGKRAGSGDDTPDSIDVVDLAACALGWRWVDDRSWAGVGGLVAGAGGPVYVAGADQLVAVDHGTAVERFSTGLGMRLAPSGPGFVGIADTGYPGAGVHVSAFASSGPPIPEETALIEGRVLAARCGSVAGLEIDAGGATTTTDAGGHYRLRVTGRGTVDVGRVYQTYPTLAAFRDPMNITTPILVTLTGARRYRADFAVNLCHGD